MIKLRFGSLLLGTWKGSGMPLGCSGHQTPTAHPGDNSLDEALTGDSLLKLAHKAATASFHKGNDGKKSMFSKVSQDQL